MSASSGTDQLVWYVGYGSNLSAARLGCYLDGGVADGAARCQPGARDATAPRADRPVDLPGTVYFAWRSPTWGGGVAFYDPVTPHHTGAAAGRAFLLGHGQLLDVLTQEMHRVPGDDPDPDVDLDAVLHGQPQVLGDGRYERVQPLPPIEGLPALTLTAPGGMDDTEPTAPSAAYLRVVAGGLVESRGWDAATCGRYLAGLPGAAGAWSPGQVAEALAAGP